MNSSPRMFVILGCIRQNTPDSAKWIGCTMLGPIWMNSKFTSGQPARSAAA